MSARLLQKRELKVETTDKGAFLGISTEVKIIIYCYVFYMRIRKYRRRKEKKVYCVVNTSVAKMYSSVDLKRLYEFKTHTNKRAVFMSIYKSMSV